jgi:rare lipoprotein A
LAGRHAARRTPSKVRYLIPLAAALLVTGVLAGVGVLTGGLGGVGARNTALAEPTTVGGLSTTTLPSASPSLPDSPSPSASRSPERASRGETRTAPPSPSPSKSPSKKASSSPATSTVVDSGTCGASFYETGQTTASGEPFDPQGLTAASKTLAFNTRVRVTNLANGKAVVVRINDRGPFVAGRCLDLARGAFVTIASISAGVLNVKFEVLKT